MTEAFLLSAVRTPIGALNGTLAEVAAPALGAVCIRTAVRRAGVSAADVSEVVMGNVVGAGVGQNPARPAGLGAGLPPAAGATTVNKVCGSGLKAVMLAAGAIRLGEAAVVVAGGMESMSRAPYLLPRARQGYRMGNGELIDAVFRDGLTDAYSHEPMGVYADRCAEACGLTRQEQDDYAVRSFTRARQASAAGAFADEIVPVEVAHGKHTAQVIEDERPGQFDEARLRALRPVFGPTGTVTAGNASSLNDGAAALVVASAAACDRLGVAPLARIVGHATFSREPEWFGLAPVGAVLALLERVGWPLATVDLFEINEAFAVVAYAAERELKIPPERLNIHGGAVALGHPIGCSGARILVTLLHALRRTGGKRGVAAACLGGGEAVALAVEMV
ncbi:MAG: acetyl-CoA C-acyltransferase [Gemmataceae bacterium]